MVIEVSKASRRKIAPLRELYREEMSCQIVHDSWHERGFLQSYFLLVDGREVGYGSVGGVGDEPKDLLKEFFVRAEIRPLARKLFRALVEASGARRVEAQTNDRLLTLMLLDSVAQPARDRILFEDAATTTFTAPGAVFRRLDRRERSHVFTHHSEPVGDWGVDVSGEIVATGGLMFHYNPPYSDIHMEVAAPWRGRGMGTLLVQELKRVSYEMDRVPAARTSADNVASRRTLEKAGMAPCAWIIGGHISER